MKSRQKTRIHMSVIQKNPMAAAVRSSNEEKYMAQVPFLRTPLVLLSSSHPHELSKSPSSLSTSGGRNRQLPFSKPSFSHFPSRHAAAMPSPALLLTHARVNKPYRGARDTRSTRVSNSKTSRRRWCAGGGTNAIESRCKAQLYNGCIGHICTCSLSGSLSSVAPSRGHHRSHRLRRCSRP